jgi:ectoine hydroxylase-related dioxygenase (phytanoyl-CoA dioxygenase family)
MVTRSVLSEELRQHFAEKGFVRVPNLLPADEVAGFGPIVDGAVRSRHAGDVRSLDERTHYEQSFQQCINLWEDAVEVRPLTFHPVVAATAAALLDVPTVRLWHDQALYKEPGGRGTDAHQDQPYWPIVEPRTVTAWIPLVDVSLEMGAMGYVPGSHRFGLRKFANIFTATGFDLEQGPEAQGVPPVFVPAEVGDVLFHHGLTIHTAGPNRTRDLRRAHTAIFFADGCTRAERPRSHPCVDRAGIQPGDAIASVFTPVAHPRPPGDLPETPPPLTPPRPNWPGWDWSRWKGWDAPRSQV